MCADIIGRVGHPAMAETSLPVLRSGDQGWVYVRTSSDGHSAMAGTSPPPFRIKAGCVCKHHRTGTSRWRLHPLLRCRSRRGRACGIACGFEGATDDPPTWCGGRPSSYLAAAVARSVGWDTNSGESPKMCYARQQLSPGAIWLIRRLLPARRPRGTPLPRRRYPCILLAPSPFIRLNPTVPCPLTPELSAAAAPPDDCP